MTNELSLVLKKHISASPAAVWRCLTEPDLLVQWFTPKPVVTFDVEIDLQPGGIFALKMQMPGEKPMIEPPGCFLLVEPETRLVWTSALAPGFRPYPAYESDADFYMTADIRLIPEAGGTIYHVTALHATSAQRDIHESYGFLDGWGTAADQMESLAKTL